MKRSQLDNLTQQRTLLAPCPRPEKRAFYSKAKAKLWLRRSKLGNGGMSIGRMSAYLCACGLFHVGNRKGGRQ